MSGRRVGRSGVLSAAALAALLVLAGCGGDDPDQGDGVPAATAPTAATAASPEAEGGSPAEAPSKADPAAYTQYLVQQAIDRYDASGPEASLAAVNSAANRDGQWYIFVIDSEGTIIGHPDQKRVGLSLHGWVGTDLNGYSFGPEMLAADEAGRWVPYVYINPPDASQSGIEFQLKNAWVKRHDGLLFGSGWYIDAEEFLPTLLQEAAGHFRAGGLEAILAFYNNPTGISAGLIPTVAYYNDTDSLLGNFAGFIAAPDGELLSHFDPGLIGTDIEDLLGPAVRSRATPDGAWITQDDNPAGTASPQTMRIYALDIDGTLIGGGWYRP